MSNAEVDRLVGDIIAARRGKRAAERSSAPDDWHPLTQTQVGIWLDQVVSGTVGRPAAIRIDGPLDREALERSIAALVERHEPLRTSYPFIDDEPVLRVHDAAPTVESVRFADDDELAQLLEAATDRHFDPESEIPVHFQLATGPDHAVLIIAMSHLAFDAWSEIVLLCDLEELYRADIAGHEPVLPSLTSTFGDHARRERRAEREGRLGRSLTYWKDRLASVRDSELLLPRTAATTPYEPLTRELSVTELEALRRLARDHGTTPFVVALTAAQIATRPLVPDDAYVISCPVSGRDDPGTHDLIGCCVNVLGFVAEPDPGETVSELVERTHVQLMESLSHRHVSVRTVRQELGYDPRDKLGRVSLQWREFPARPRPDRNSDASSFRLLDVTPRPRTTTELRIRPHASGATVQIRYPAGLDRGAVEALADDLAATLRWLPKNMGAAVGSAPVSPPANLALPAQPTVVETIADVVDRNPAAVAIESWSPGSTTPTTLDYAALWERSGAIAAALRAAGAGVGDRVAIIGPQAPALAISLIAVMRSGAVACPIDDALPRRRQQRLTEIAQASHAVTIGGASAPGTIAAVVRVDEGGRIDRPIAPFLGCEAATDAYIFFTSGTTGEPKGVLGTHHGLSHFLEWERRLLDLHPADRVLAVAGPGFDVSLRDVFLPLTSGATLCYASGGIDPGQAMALLRTTAATVVHVTPTLAGVWLADDRSVGDGTGSLRATLFSGELLDGDLVARWRRRSMPMGTVYNLYGPTETCMVRTFHEVAVDCPPGPVPAGRPLPGTTISVVGENGEPCNPGELGEIVIRTSTGTKGYVPTAAEAADQLDEPAPDVTHAVQTYRTGDLGRLDRDGVLTVEGRRDDQVKVDGVRVEPGEVQAQLLVHPSVSDCRVLPSAGAPVRLHAFVVLAEGGTTDGLRDHLRERLPAAAVPSTFTAVPGWPRTPTNKLDRTALLARLDHDPRAAALETSGSRTAALREIWERTLDVAPVGDDDDFFMLGGTSLGAVRIRAAVDADLGLSLPVRLLFENPRFHDFALAVAALGTETEPSDVEPSGRLDIAGAVDTGPLTATQEAMVAAWLADPDSLVNHLFRAFVLTGPLDQEALSAAVDAVIARHEALRMRLGFVGSQPTAAVDPADTGRLVIVPAPDGDVSGFVRAAIRPLVLSDEPLVRCTLGVIEPRRHVLVVAAHHSIIDGHSLDLLFRELGAAYEAARSGAAAASTPSRPPAASVLDYSRELEAEATSTRRRAELDWWLATLEDTPDPPRLSGAQEFSVTTATHDLDPALIGLFERVERTTGTTRFTAGLAAWAAFLMAETGRDDLCIATPMADLAWAPSTSTIGSYAALRPLRIRKGAADTFVDLLATVRTAVLGALEHARVPFERVAAVRRDSDADRLLAHQFQLQAGATPLGYGLSLSGIDIEIEPISHDRSGVETYCRFHDGGRVLELLLRDVPTAAEAMSARFVDFLGMVLSSPDTPLTEVQARAAARPSSTDLSATREITVSFAQERMWILDHLQPGQPIYNTPSRRTITGRLDADTLERALVALVARHEALRTRIETRRGAPVGLLDDRGRFPMTQHDLGGADPDQAVALLDELMESPRPIDGQTTSADLVQIDDEGWILQLVVHHAYVDLWSYEVIWRDLAELYSAFASGRTPELGPIASAPDTVAAEQRRLLLEGGYDDDLDWWTGTLAAPLPAPVLPRTHTENSAAPAAAIDIAIPLSPETLERLDRVRLELGVTPFILASTITAAAIGAHFDRDDVILGAPFAERPTGTANTVGLFVNTVPFRFSVGGAVTFRDLAAHGRSVMLTAYAHGAVPFDLVVDHIGADRSDGHPLVDTLLTVREAPPAAVTFGDAVASSMQFRRRMAKTPLGFHVNLADDAHLVVTGAADRCSSDDLRTLAQTWIDLAERGCLDPDAPLVIGASTMSRPGAATSRHSSDTDGAHDPGETVLDAAVRCARRDPTRAAIVGPDITVTRGDLAQRADVVARTLLGRALARGTVVGVLADRGVDALAAALGIWRAGLVYAPIDPALPAARIDRIIAQGAMPLVIRATDEPVPRLSVPVIEPDSDAGTDPAIALPSPPAPEDAAYVIFTSGSTGEPKGVLVSHRAMATFCREAAAVYQVDASDRILHFHSPAFDASFEETFLPLALGATIVLRSPTMLGSFDRLLGYCRDHRITVLDLPTTLWRELTHSDLSRVPALPDDLRVVIIGGEAADAGTVERWLSHFGTTVPVVNAYGPTETTVVVTATTLDLADIGPDGAVPIGRPFPSTEVRVVDPDGNETSDWGELWVAGPQLAERYLGAPELTAERFPTKDGRRWYRTGDRARRRDDGQLLLAGRLDTQVKIDGHRIELGEIETTLLRHHSVTAASAFVIHGPDGPRLLAAVVPSGPVDVEDLRAHVAAMLPSAMMPREIRVVAELPRTPGGKVDRAALVGHVEADPAPDTAEGPPTAAPDIAETLRTLWIEILDTDTIEPDDDFFDLGGRSLTAVRLAHEIADRLDIDIPVVDIFDHPTLHSLTTHLTGTEPEPTSSAAPPEATTAPDPATDAPPAAAVDAPEDADRVTIHHQERRRAPLSAGQRRLWLHQQVRAGELAYSLTMPLRIRGDVDVTTVQGCVDRLVARHAILRTRFVPDSTGRPEQVVDPSGTPIEIVELGDVPPHERLRAAETVITDRMAGGFDLAVEPPFRAVLATIDHNDHLVSFQLHHIAFDGRSTKTLVEDFTVDLARALGHDLAPPPVPELQFADYAAWQADQARSGAHGDALEYWERRLHGLEVPDLPGRSTNPVASGRVEEHEVDLPDHIARELLTLARRTSASPFQLLAAMVTALLHRVTASTDVSLGSAQDERRDPRLDRTVGPFVNMVVVRSEVDPAAPFVDLIRALRRTTAEALEHGLVPFEDVVDRLNPPRDPMRLPFFDVTCLVQESEPGDLLTRPRLSVERHELEADPIAERRRGLLSDLMVTATVDAERLRLTLRHDPGVVETAAVAQLASSLGVLAEAVVADDRVPVGMLPILRPAEERWLLDTLNATGHPFEASTRVEERLLRVAAAQPTATAIRHGARALSYQGLMDAVDDLRVQLSDAGVQPGDAVGVEAPRSIELVIALVAVLRSGAAYVPIDPASPEARTAAMLDRTGSRLVVVGDGGALRVLTRPTNAKPVAELADAAYVMFTSGSTGEPKGVVVPHAAIQRLVTAADYALLDDTAVVAMGSNPAFDALTFEVWGSLLNGGTIVVIDQEDLVDPDRLARLLEREKVTTAFFTTALFNSIVRTRPDAFASLRDVLVGGEALDPESMARALTHPPARLANIYGPTECTTFSSWHEIHEVDGPIPIGLPIVNTELHVLDARGRLVPPGIVGELHIGGPGLALGYLGDPELTNARFRTDALDGRRLYRTGDLVRRRPDGAIDFVGRADAQVKVRGHRIELGEVEAALRAHPDVADAVASVVGEGNHRELVAHVVAAEPGVDSAVLRAHLGERIPAYMVPGRIGRVDAIPLTPQGKIDRRALPPVDRPVADPQSPTDAATASILQIWHEVLERSDIGPDDDFFESGGNSLLAVEVLAAIEQRHEVSAPLSIVFEARTPRDLAGALGLTDRPVTGQEPTRSGLAIHTETLHVGTDSSLAPLWVVHPAGGALTLFEPLVHRLDGRRTVFGVVPPGVRDNRPPLDTVAALVDHQLANIRARQPDGPYHLIGYSLGGILALEIARRLVADGSEVAFAGVIESSLPRPDQGGPSQPGRLRTYTGHLRRGELRSLGGRLAGAARRRAEQLAIDRLGVEPSIARRREVVGMASHRAFYRYAPSPADVAVVLFFGADIDDEVRHREVVAGWESVATRGARLVLVQGSHQDDAVMWPPAVDSLAAAVAAEIET